MPVGPQANMAQIEGQIKNMKTGGYDFRRSAKFVQFQNLENKSKTS